MYIYNIYIILEIHQPWQKTSPPLPLGYPIFQAKKLAADGHGDDALG